MPWGDKTKRDEYQQLTDNSSSSDVHEGNGLKKSARAAASKVSVFASGCANLLRPDKPKSTNSDLYSQTDYTKGGGYQSSGYRTPGKT